MKRTLKLLLCLLLGFTALVMAYFATAAALVLVPLPARQGDAQASVNAYVYSNGVHTDFVFPLHAQGVDWSLAFPPSHLAEPPGDAAFVAIGWGDREFYLNTPHWKDLSFGRAVHALSGTGRSLLHVTYWRDADLSAADRQASLHALHLSAQQYATLARYVESSMVRSAAGPGVNVPGQHYGQHDAFYEARGAYNLFATCNAWTGRGLANAGVKVSPWTPLASQVVWHLPRP